MQELKALSAIVNSTGADMTARENARRNFDLLCREIGVEVREENFAEANSYFGRSGATPKPTPAEESVGKKGIAQQSEAVLTKRRAIAEELGKESKKVADAAARSPVGMRGRRGSISSLLSDAQALAAEGEQQVQTDRWVDNRAFRGETPATPPPAASGGPLGTQLYLNDNVVLQQRNIEPRQTAVAGQADEAGDLKRLPVVKLEFSASRDRPAEVTAKPQAQPLPPQQALSTARSNAQNLEQQQQRATPSPSPQGPARPDKDRRIGSGREKEKGSDGVEVNRSTARGLQTAGRISLAVDFPLEGEVFHFQKVKSNARLVLQVTKPHRFARLGYFGLALVLGAALHFLRRASDRSAHRP